MSERKGEIGKERRIKRERSMEEREMGDRKRERSREEKGERR